MEPTVSFWNGTLTHVLVWIVLVSSCGFGDGTLPEADPEAVPEVVTYHDHVGPRINYYCTGCHDADGSVGASGGYDFSTYEQATRNFNAIIRTVLEQSMPPGASRKMTARDEAILLRWEELGFPESEVAP